MEMFIRIPIWRSEECAISSTRRIVRIAERYKKKAHILHITTKQEIDFLSQHKGNITFENNTSTLNYICS